MAFIENHAILRLQPHNRTLLWHVARIRLTTTEAERKAQPVLQPGILNASKHGSVGRDDDHLREDLIMMARLDHLNGYIFCGMTRLERRYLQHVKVHENLTSESLEEWARRAVAAVTGVGSQRPRLILLALVLNVWAGHSWGWSILRTQKSETKARRVRVKNSMPFLLVPAWVDREICYECTGDNTR